LRDFHFLNRMTQGRRSDEDPAIAVDQATVLLGPALILTALVLARGLAALVFSDLPPFRWLARWPCSLRSSPIS
jgi:predicted RND superfamily exporter protein